jgi:hypothetical protein
MASTARPRIRTVRSKAPLQASSREQALQRIAAIIEKHMSDEGLDEKEKDAKVATFAAMVDEEITVKRKQHATPLKRH